MKRLTWLVPTALLIAASLLQKCSTDIAFSGGGGTETVGLLGKVVDLNGVPVDSAIVTAKLKNFAGMTIDSLSSVSDYAGIFHLDSLDSGTYALEAYSGDSTLMLPIQRLTFTPKISVSAYEDIGELTMVPPGSISGVVQLQGKTAHGDVDIFIPGTSYDARSNDAGYFYMSKVPVGTYDLTFMTDGYSKVLVNGIIVASSFQTKIADTIQMSIDTTVNPPAPLMPKAAYDTLTGIARITWPTVTVADLAGYRVFIDSGKGFSDSRWTTVQSTLYIDTIFRDMKDTTTRARRYKLKSIDKDSNLCLYFSPTASLTAASPTLLRTTFTFTLLDSAKALDSFRVAVACVNKIRPIATLGWYADNGAVPLRPVTVNALQKRDTLKCLFRTIGRHVLRVETVDTANYKCSDSLVLKVDSAAIIPERNEWDDTFNKQISQGRYYLSVAVLGNKIYAIGGEYLSVTGLSTCAQVDTVSFKDTIVGKAMNLPTGVQYSAAAVMSDTIFVFGGSNQSRGVTIVQKYTPGTGWRTAGNMPTPRKNHSATVLNNAIYLIGGTKENNSEAVADIDRFDPATNSFSKVGQLIIPRQMHQAVVLNNKIYIIGGFGADDESVALNSVEIWDPLTGQSSILGPSLQQARANFSACAVNGSIYVFGGVPSLTENCIASVERFNPAIDAWETRASMPMARFGFGAAVLGNAVYIIGGVGNGIYTQTRTISPGFKVISRYYP
jgi:hypothetical protein